MLNESHVIEADEAPVQDGHLGSYCRVGARAAVLKPHLVLHQESS